VRACRHVYLRVFVCIWNGDQFALRTHRPASVSLYTDTMACLSACQGPPEWHPAPDALKAAAHAAVAAVTSQVAVPS
jgi:hypothetical protein